MTAAERRMNILAVLQDGPLPFKHICALVSGTKQELLEALTELRILRKVQTDDSIPRLFSLTPAPVGTPPTC